MDQDIILQAYKNLIVTPDSENKNILNRLSDWLCNFLNNDEERVFYYSLPIWNYVSNNWDSNFTMGISKSNDPFFKGQRGWLNVFAEDEKKERNRKLEGTMFYAFYSASELSAKGFSFVEFVTQNATAIEPVFSIEYVKDNNDATCRFEFDKSHLRLINNNEDSNLNKINTDTFISSIYKILMVSNENLLEEKQKENLISLYDFLCLYQKHFGTDLRYIYLVTSRLFKDKMKDLSSGGLVLVCKEKIDTYKLYTISAIVNLCYREKGGKNWEEKCRKEAVKSAISAIMSRNMSHNLGSHYMYYTKAHLEALADKTSDIAPDIRGAAKVLSYIQGRMDYLATIISNDRFPYGAVNFKSQIFDELTIDDFSHRHFPNDENKRTTNFLLTNLIQSENYTRSDVRSDKRDVDFGKLHLYVKYSSDGEKYRDFTGTWHSNTINWIRKENKICAGSIRTMDDEQDVKTELSLLNIALPGGSMSCHAFFNVIENFIRNSAKYLKDDIPNELGLVCTIAIKPNEDNPNYIDLIIYDNKGNGNTSLFDELNNKLRSLIIIDKDNQISKENKGFKEMLFSSVWMNAYNFEGKTCGDIIAEINQAEVGEKKLELIKKHGFSLVKVHVADSGGITIYDEKADCKVKCNLGVKITLPIFMQCQPFNLSGNEASDVNAMLNMMSDVVLVDDTFKQSDFREVFTRPLVVPNGKELTVLEQYKEAIKKRFPQIEDYFITFDDEETDIEEESDTIVTNNESQDDQFNKDKYCIYFKRHADTSGKDPSLFKKYAYADTISGGNFTITLSELYQNGIGAVDEQNKTVDLDEIFALKIKESALTRITIIDERLFNSAKTSDYPWLSLKNIRLLNIKDCDEVPETDNLSLSPIFEGNSFMDNSDKTHFLSIHLGLLEKILKDSKYVNAVISRYLKDSADEYTLSEKRVEAFMELLQKQFGYVEIDNATHFAIHSGRGNYSHELDVSLMKYPFITLSALESVYNNSKYLLSQLFYNTVYIGKGYAKRTKKD